MATTKYSATSERSDPPPLSRCCHNGGKRALASSFHSLSLPSSSQHHPPSLPYPGPGKGRERERKESSNGWKGRERRKASLSLSLLLSWLCVQIGAEGGRGACFTLILSFLGYSTTVGRSRVGRRKMVVARRSALDSLSCPSIAVRST